MKTRDKIIVFCLIILLILLHRFLFSTKEGFIDSNPDYETLKNRLSTTFNSYCKVSSFVRDQLKTMITGSREQMKKIIAENESAAVTRLLGKSSDNSINANTDDASQDAADEDSLNKTYKSVYSCTDSLASSRPSCGIFSGKGPNKSMVYVSCNTYTKLPAWSEDGEPVIALMKITDDLPERLVREAEWFSAIIKKLQDALAAGENPPTEPPSEEEINKIADDAKKDGFTGTCSAAAARAKKLANEAAGCSIPDIESEIARVNTLLDNPLLKRALSLMDTIFAAMLKLQSDLEKAKNGTLYEWQKDGPKKEFPKFQGGDRVKGIIFSMQQSK